MRSEHVGTGTPYDSEERSEERRVEGMKDEDGLVRGQTTPDCTTKNSKPIKMFFQDVMDRHGHPDSFGKQANMRNTSPQRQSPLSKLTPHVSSKLARNAALIGAMVLAPMAGLCSQMKNAPDFLEIAVPQILDFQLGSRRLDMSLRGSTIRKAMTLRPLEARRCFDMS